MSRRDALQPLYNGRPVRAPGMLRHGSYSGSESVDGHQSIKPLPLDTLEDKIADQAADIDKLLRENRKLANAHGTLRQELVEAEKDVQTMHAHIRSIQTESDIQMRVLLDKIAKMEANIEGGEGLKKDLQQAHKEAQNLVKAKQELTFQIQQATQELQKAKSDNKSLPTLLIELENLRQEHHRLRTTFEHEKGMNIELVERMKATEKNLIALAREVERLRAEVLNAEKRAYAMPTAPSPYGSAPLNPDPTGAYSSHLSVANGYVDIYGRPQVAMGAMVPAEGPILHTSENGLTAAGIVVEAAALGSNDASYDPSLVRK